MTKRTKKKTEETLVDLVEAREHAQDFFERNQNLIFGITALIVIIIGGFFAYGVVSNEAASGGYLSAPALAATASILVPIVIFWFLALLVWLFLRWRRKRRGQDVPKT